MKLSFEQVLIEVWRQALVEDTKAVLLGSERYAVRKYAKHEEFGVQAYQESSCIHAACNAAI